MRLKLRSYFVPFKSETSIAVLLDLTMEQPQQFSQDSQPASLSFDVNAAQIEAEAIHFVFVFQGKEYAIKCPPDETIGVLKTRLYDMTNVMPIRQKILGLKPAAAVSDAAVVSMFAKPGAKNRFMLMGTPESQIPEEPSDRPSIFDDFDFDYVPDQSEIQDHAEREKKLKETIALTEIRMMHEFDPAKKLLVLDLDHTLFDFGARERVPRLWDTARPGLEHFLVSIAPFYNLVVWSQTSWRWLEVKLTELGLIAHPKFKFNFVLDKESMFKVKTFQKKVSKVIEHYVKPLQVIWSLLPQFGPHNTLHVDDLARNFAMNPRNGIPVSAYYVGPKGNNLDQELFDLTRYLIHVASAPNVSSFDHSKWRQNSPQ